MKNRWIKYGLWVMTSVLCGLIVWVNFAHFCYKMNSDIASEAVLARLIWNTKELIPASWIPSSEVRVIETPQIASLFYGITGSMNLSMSITALLLLCGILVSLILFLRKTELEANARAITIFLCLALPGNMIIMECLYFFACYYAVHVIVFFITLYGYCELLNDRNKTCPYVNMMISAFLAVLLGMQGARGILVIYGPMFGIEGFRQIYSKICGTYRGKRDRITGLWTVGLLVLSFGGNSLGFSVRQTFSRNIRRGPEKLFKIVLPDMAHAMGFAEGHMARNMCLGVFSLCALGLVIWVLIRLLGRQAVSRVEYSFLIVTASPVVTALIVSFTTVESSERYYFMWMFSIPLAVAIWEQRIWNYERLRSRIALGGIAAVLVSLIVVINIGTLYLPILRADDLTDGEDLELIEYLQKSDCTIAYSSFENANRLTVEADGDINVYAIDSFETLGICRWLTSTQWYPPALERKGRTAYIVPDSENENFERFLQSGADCGQSKKIGQYTVWIADYNYTNGEQK